jgi:hypothetical protein
MGKDSQGTEANSSGSETRCLGTCEAHDVGVSPQEDCGGTKGTVGEVEGGEEEGGLEPVQSPANHRRDSANQ